MSCDTDQLRVSDPSVPLCVIVCVCAAVVFLVVVVVAIDL